MNILSQHIGSIGPALYLFAAWVCVWSGFLYGDMKLHRGPRKSGSNVSAGNSAPSRSMHPAHPELTRYSTVLIACMFLFYTASFSGLTKIETPIFSMMEGGRLTPFGIFAFLLAGIGAYLMIASRFALGSLYSREVVFSLNPDKVNGGVYKYLRHPMYLGMGAILASSFLFFPTLLGVLSACVIGAMICAKARVEDRNSKCD